ncbi:MAG: CoA ester lyase [Burkholderiaceae bacterium]|nr:CoA ester lyase [Burkholderiaceae bacterium]
MPAALPPTPRNPLFVPGHRPERFAKARQTGADLVIIDLEDAVAPQDKDGARQTIAAWLDSDAARAPGCPVWLRVNGADTPWFDADAALLAHPGLAGAVCPKADGAAPLAALRQAAARELPLIPLIETAAGIAALDAIAATPGVWALAFGAIDFQVDLGIQASDDDMGEELLFFRSRIVLASRLAGLAAPIDGVCTRLDDPQALALAAARARRLGFGGKLCIHPSQVAPCRAAFSPTATQQAWAQRVLDAAAQAGGAAVAVDGKMVDLPVMRQAQAIVAAAARDLAGDPAGEGGPPIPL